LNTRYRKPKWQSRMDNCCRRWHVNRDITYIYNYKL